MSRTFGELNDLEASANHQEALQFDTSLPAHWPPWARLADHQVRQVHELTPDDLEFLATGFGEQLPWLMHEEDQHTFLKSFEEWRYGRFCLTFNGYDWIEKEYPNSGENPVVVLSAIYRRVRMIAGGDLDGSPVANDAWMRLATACSFSEIRASMFHCQRAHHHWSGGGPTLLEAYPELHQMSRALSEMLRNKKTKFWEEPFEEDNG